MSDYQLDDELLLAVRAARPDIPDDAVSQNGAAAKATLDRVLASHPRRTYGVPTWLSRIRASRRFGDLNWSTKPRLGVVMPVISVVVVVVVAVVFLSLRGGGSSGSSASSASGAVELVYLAEPSPQAPHVTSAALQRAVEVMRHRIQALGLSGATVQTSGAAFIAVKLPDVKNQQLAESEVGTVAELYFYDWEANALMSSGGKTVTVATWLQTQDPTALQISQGTSFAAPGDAHAGSLPLYQAVKLASEQPKWLSSHNTRLGPQYYLFGAPGSTACAAKAKQQDTTPAAGQHCLLAGPDNELYTTSYHQSVQNLASQLPPGVSPSDGQVLVVQQGTVVLQAANPSSNEQTKFSSPSAQFYVLHDNVALRGSDITHPQQSTNQTGNPDVTFGFTAVGRSAFRNLSATIARRGRNVSTISQTLNQHFAVALDNQLLTVAALDFRTYPDGVTSGDGEITSDLTTHSAKQLADELRLGALPINLRLISSTRIAATHQH